MVRFVPKTLFKQLVIGSLAAQSVFLLCFTYWVVRSQENSARLRTRQRLADQLARLTDACDRIEANGNQANLQRVLQLSLIAPTIQTARVTDLDGHTLAIASRARPTKLDRWEIQALPVATRQQLITVQNGEAEGVSPIQLAGKSIALLWLEPNHALALNTLYIVLRIVLYYGLLALLANVLPLFLIVRTVTTPLSRLRRATHFLVSGGDLKGAFPLPVTSHNEAGDLTASYNAMAARLDQQQRGLSQTLALLDSMLKNAPIGFAFFAADLRCTRLNHNYAEMTGVCEVPDAGVRLSDVAAHAAIAREIEGKVQTVLSTAEPVQNVELSWKASSQSGRSWLAHFYPVYQDNDGSSAVGSIIIEITQRLQAEELLRRTEKLAATGQLAASIAHEINNPLEAVTNLLYLLSHHSSLDGAAAEYVRSAQSELARVSEITQQMLRFYRQSTNPAMTAIPEILDSVLSLFSSRLSSQRIRVRKRYRGTPAVFGYSGELRQVFANLIGNAIDAMPRGGVLSLRVHESCGRWPDGTWRNGVRIFVADSGNGMSPQTIQRIFEPFFTTKQMTGTGLGLWVSEEIIRKHSGSVRVRSREGADSGTGFMLFFPEVAWIDNRAPVLESDLPIV